MTKAIEIAAMALGGLSLFAVSFLGFALLSGKPLHEIGVLERLVDPPVDLERAEHPDMAGEPQGEPRPDVEVLQAGVGTMSVWSLPSPYSADELEALAAELKGKLTVLQLREADLDQRKRELAEEKTVLADRVATLETLRSQLEEFQRELELRELEVIRSENAKSERESLQWQDVAKILTDLDEATAGQRLTEYPPEEAAAILRAMSPEQAAPILNGIPTERWKEYVDAYTKLAE